MAKSPKPARGQAWGILNPSGDLWTYQTFKTEAAARQHIANFWRNTSVDQASFRPTRVRITVSALPTPTTQGETP